ncbi:sugar kinase [bacterium]|nr:sugar kinase [bacterium]
MSTSKPILVVGSAALDTLKTPFGDAEDALGGSSFYFSTAASLLAPVRLVAVVGTDFPREKIAFLDDRNVDMEGLETAEGSTFRWGGRYYRDPNKRDTLFTRLGVFEAFDPKIPEHFRQSPFVFLGNIHPALQLKVLDQIDNPELIVLDTMNFWIQGTPKELEAAISRTNVLIVNDEEAYELTNEHSLLDAAENLMKRGPKTVVVKKGQHGAVLFREDGDIFFAPAYPLRVVKDATGAGDTFAGGFIGYLASHDLNDPMVWRRAIIHGSVVASFVVEDFSMERTKDLIYDEIMERVKKFHDMTEF